eukprot:CAMPEP_0117673128 /NCGR_PEP_ID=MMETSP0804-20121206/14300_1 /TAXON_ID=1074897 /ORGANISM="Tetraselmis astigmatica, Strain CCMP880" /LENGTH=137 /DNA_ID=CAMNT_0005481831 /DNA_START=149 /DNA_END=560 /DNA_ORIENTATION=+
MESDMSTAGLPFPRACLAAAAMLQVDPGGNAVYLEGAERILMAGGFSGSGSYTVGVLFFCEGLLFFGRHLLYLTAPFHWMPRPRATVSSRTEAVEASGAAAGVESTTKPILLLLFLGDGTVAKCRGGGGGVAEDGGG